MAVIELNTRALVELCHQNNVVRLSIFGSFARGEATEDSDVDLLVEFSQRNSLLGLIALERKMSAALGRKVDLLTREAISPYLRGSIERDLRVVYDAG
jgi:predicted nucleotidyltransferase